MTRYMKSLLFLLLLMSQVAGGDVPGVWAEEVQLDRDNNIFDYAFERVVGNYGIPFFEFHVPIDRVDFTMGSQEDIPAAYWPVIKTESGSYVRFFVPNLNESNYAENAPIRKFIRDFGEPVKEWKGTQIQGKASFHMHDPLAPESEPIRIKIERQFSRFTANRAAQGKYSVLLSSLIKKLEGENPNPLVSFYVEPFSASIKGADYTYTYLLRKIPREASERSSTEAFVPLHGFLGSRFGFFGSRLFYRIMRESHRRPRAWVTKEYLPKLAQVSAYYNFKLGIWIEGHTQNMSLLINRKDGKILKFFVKDAADVLISPFQQALAGSLPAYDFVPPGRANENWINPDFDSYKYVGHNAGTYMFDSVKEITGNQTTRYQNMAVFLESYIEAAGLQLSQLSERSQKAIKFYGRSRFVHLAYRVGKFYSGGAIKTPSENEVFDIMQEIADLKMKLDFQKRLADYSRTLDVYELSGLERITDLHIANKKFNFAMPDSETQMIHEFSRRNRGFLPVRNGIIVYDKETKIPVGAAYHLSEKDAQFVNSLVPSSPKIHETLDSAKIDCEVGLESLATP